MQVVATLGHQNMSNMGDKVQGCKSMERVWFGVSSNGNLENHGFLWCLRNGYLTHSGPWHTIHHGPNAFRGREILPRDLLRGKAPLGPLGSSWRGVGGLVVYREK